MKLLIISDLHSNVEGVKAIWAKESDADAVYMAGDQVDYGTDPVATIDWVRSHGVHCVRGNHDDRLLRVWSEGRYAQMDPEHFAWVHHNCCRLDEERIAYLRGLPMHLSFIADGYAYLMTHRYGDAYQIIESRYHFDRYWEEHFDLAGAEGLPRRMIFGHSHRQQIMCFGEDRLWLNPGSASYRRPDEPSKDAFYARITDGKITLHHVTYDRRPLYEEARRVRPMMMDDEWRVADFFFGWREEDGPDTAWINELAERRRTGRPLPGKC